MRRFPHFGRIVPEFSQVNLREVIYENYGIVYAVVADDVFAVAVLHGSMDVAAGPRQLSEDS